MRRLATVVLTAALTAGVLAGCGGGNWATKCTTKDGVVQCTPAERTQIKDNVTGTLLDGGTYDLASARGKVVVVNFWGSWCSPCRAEADDLEKTYQATQAQGVTFIGVDTRDDKDSAKQFVRGRITYPSIYDFDGKVALEFDVTASSTPATLIIDRQGRIADAIRQSTTYTQLLPLVQKVAAEGSG